MVLRLTQIGILYSLPQAILQRNTIPLTPPAELGRRAWSRLRRLTHFHIPSRVRFPFLPITTPNSRLLTAVLQPLLKPPHSIHTNSLVLEDGSCTRWLHRL
jgi:hypothetical protein